MEAEECFQGINLLDMTVTADRVWKSQVGINVTLKEGLAPSPQEFPAFG